jgi:hypothetical protein
MNILDFNNVQNGGDGTPTVFLRMKRFDDGKGGKDMKFFTNYSKLSTEIEWQKPFANIFKVDQPLPRGFAGVISGASLRFNPANHVHKIAACWDIQLEAEIEAGNGNKIKVIIQERIGSRRILDLMNPILSLDGILIDNPITISPYEFIKDGKTKSGVSVKEAETNLWIPQKFSEWDNETKFFAGVPPITSQLVGTTRIFDNTDFERFMFMECFHWIKSTFGQFPDLTPTQETKAEAMKLLKGANTNQSRSSAAAFVSILIRDEATRQGLVGWYNSTYPNTPLYALDGVGVSFEKPVKVLPPIGSAEEVKKEVAASGDEMGDDLPF